MRPVFVAACVLPVLDVAVCLLVTEQKPLPWLDRLLDWGPGQYWPAAAATLPALIPIARTLQENAPSVVQGGTVAFLLLAVAVLQLYGQERNNRDRIKTEDRFSDLFNEIRQARRETSSIGTEVRRIADGITALADEVREGRREARDAAAAIAAEISEGRREARDAAAAIAAIAAGVVEIANAFSDFAAQAAEEEE
jgi:methyl-accepting chemotaxis protein